MISKIGLALGGGGSRGSYQIGIIKALEEEKILIDVKHVSGSSVGAINTLMILGNLSCAQMMDNWLSIKNGDLYKRSKKQHSGLYDIKHLYERLYNTIPLNEIRKSKIKGYTTLGKVKDKSLINQVITKRMKKEVVCFNDVKNPHKIALASVSLPLLFRSTTIEDEHYVDGGILDICPVQTLIDKGCNIIIAVPIHGWFNDKRYQKNNILLVNMEPQLIFNKAIVDIISFKPDGVVKKADYGYKIGKFLIGKLRELNYLDESNNWVKPKGYHVVSISKAEEKKLKI